jgi:peroxiredoxin
LENGEIPRQSAEFVVKLTTGQQHLVSEYRGKVLALAFVLTTCPHCQVASRTLEKLYEQYRPEGFEVAAAATNNDAVMLVPDFIQKLGLTFPVGVAPFDAACEYLQHPVSQRFTFPRVVFIDRKGIIRAIHPENDNDMFFKEDVQENNMRQVILSLLRQGRATKAKTSAGKAGS